MGGPRSTPEEARPRHADDPVLGAEPRRLEGDRVEHLRERERQHDEVHAAHPDREEADDERGEGGGRRPAATSPAKSAGRALEQERGDVAADAEERGVAERHHAGVAHEEVEAHGEDAPDQDFLEELDRVAAGDERAGTGRDRGEHARQRSAPWRSDRAQAGRHRGAAHERHRSGRPKSPCGRTSTTSGHHDVDDQHGGAGQPRLSEGLGLADDQAAHERALEAAEAADHDDDEGGDQDRSRPSADTPTGSGRR